LYLAGQHVLAPAFGVHSGDYRRAFDAIVSAVTSTVDELAHLGSVELTAARLRWASNPITVPVPRSR
jgi:hypothetical protein